MKSNESISVSQLDIDFTEIIWTANGAKKNLDKQQIQILNAACEQYRLYAQGDRKAKVIVQQFITQLKGRRSSTSKVTGLSTEEMVKMRPHIYERRTDGAVFAMQSGSDSKEDDRNLTAMGFNHQIMEDRRPKEKTVRHASNVIGRHANKQLKMKERGVPAVRIRQKLFGTAEVDVNQIRTASEKMAVQMDRQEVMMQNFLGSMAGMMAQRREDSSGDVERLEVQLMEVQKVNLKMAKEIEKLREAQLKKENICEVSWSDIPEWISLQYSKGWKNLAINVAKLPFKTSAAVFNKFVYQPMYDVYRFWERKVMFIWGHILWVTVIGMTVYVYMYKGDEINKILKTIRPVGDILLFPARKAAQWGNYYFPSFAEYMNSVGAWSWHYLIEPLVLMIYNFVLTMGNFFIGGVNNFLGKFDLKTTWFEWKITPYKTYNPIETWTPWFGWQDAEKYNKIIMETVKKMCMSRKNAFDHPSCPM